MNTKFQILLLLSFCLLLGLMSSCDKENIDDETSFEEFPVDTIYCNLAFQIESVMGGIPLEVIMVDSITSGVAPYSYLWNTGDTTSLIVAPTVGFYFVTVTDGNNCTAADSVEVLLNTTPCDSSLFVNIIVEDIDSLGITMLTAIPSGSVAPYFYLWSTGETENNIEVTTSGTYSVTITDSEGCDASATIMVNVPDPCIGFLVQIFLNEDTMGTTQDFLVGVPSGGTPAYSFLWSNGDTGGGTDVTNMPGIYGLTVEDSAGCTAENSFTVP